MFQTMLMTHSLPSIHHNLASNVTGLEALRLMQEGRAFVCPQCGSMIKTLPEDWSEGMPLYGIECPMDQRHFRVHFEDEHAMKEMRSRMKAKAAKKK